MRTSLPIADSARLDTAAARLGVSADAIATAAVVDFLAGRIAPRRDARKRHARPRPGVVFAGRIAPQVKEGCA